MFLNVSFWESEPYCLGGVPTSSLQAKSECEGNPVPSPIIEFEEIEELEERLSSAVKEGDAESNMTFNQSEVTDQPIVENNDDFIGRWPFDEQWLTSEPVNSELMNIDFSKELIIEKISPSTSPTLSEESVQNILSQVKLNPTLN